MVAGGDLAMVAAVASGLFAYRLSRCPVCLEADCWGAAGGLCNNQRPGVARAETLPPPPATGAPVTDSRQLSLFGNTP